MNSDEGYNILQYQVFGLCLLFGVIRNTFWKLDQFPSSGELVGDTYSVGSVRKIEPQSRGI
jgi:hypothetical protein